MPAKPTEDERLMLEVEGHTWPLKGGDVIGRLGTVGGEALRGYDVLSRQHLRVEHKGGRWQITLLPKVGNETRCNGEAMTTGMPVPVTGPCEIQVVTLTMRITPGASADEPKVAEHPTALVTLDKRLHVLWRNRAATQLLRDDLAPGTDFLRLLETGATLRLRYALLELRDGVELEECEVASHTEDGSPWLALRATRCGDERLLALRDVTLERQQRDAVRLAASRLDAKMGALTTLLTAKAFVDGDLAAALPLLAQDAAELLDDTSVSIWLPTAVPRAESAPVLHACRAVAGGGSDAIGREATLTKAPVRGEASQAVLGTLRAAGMLEEATASAWIEPVGEDGLLVFQRQDATRPWLAPETRLIGLAVALMRQLFANVQRRDAMSELKAREAALSEELTAAAQYVERRLPAVITKGHVAVDWVYQPCGRLGGDTFGYEWLDDQRFAIYIADVMGHGSKAALHALSLSQTLKLLLARGGEGDPASWLASLNKEFPMRANQDLLWTMWCGLYDRKSRTLRHASGGHPPALLCHEGQVTELNSPGPVLGAMEDAQYQSATETIPENAKLFLFTDGVYEFPTAEEDAGTMADFSQAVGVAAGMKQGECAFLRTRAAGLCAEPDFPDDFTIVRARFAR